MKVKFFSLGVLGATTICVFATFAVLGRRSQRTAIPAIDSREPSTTKAVSAKALERPAKALSADSEDRRVEVEVITVRAGALEPAEIVRPHGRFILAVNNHSGESELLLHLDSLDGNRFHQVRMPKGRIRWNPLLDLPPGDYVLGEQNHPDWVCRIKLTPK